MSRLLPFRSDETTPTPEQPPRVVDLDSDDADQVFGALSSDTARRIYTCLHEEPRTPSDIADEIDSSI
jgi:DNA-binding transcriptional ArsR family regulator